MEITSIDNTVLNIFSVVQVISSLFIMWMFYKGEALHEGD